MTLSDLAGNLERKYPKQAEQGFIEDITAIMAGQPDAAITAAFDAYRTEWNGFGCPSSGWFSKKLEELGYKTSRAARDHSTVFQGAWLCVDCGAAYSLSSFACPRCGSRNTKGVTDAAGTAMIDVQEDCWQCATKERGTRVYGPDCDKFGRGEMSYEYCDDCVCRQCCLFANRVRTRPDSLKKMQGDVKNLMPWMGGPKNG
jgi:hypothetical protein